MASPQAGRTAKTAGAPTFWGILKTDKMAKWQSSLALAQ
jgi:hypothetical protein